MTDPMRRILILLTEGYADWETGMIAANIARVDGVRVEHSSLDGGEVTSLGGLRVTGLAPFAPRAEDVIVLCGGQAWGGDAGLSLRARLTPILLRARAEGASLAGICAAAHALGVMGFVEGLPHTGNGPPQTAYPGSDLYVDQRHALRNGGVVTASGAAPASFAAQVFCEAGAEGKYLTEISDHLRAEFAFPWDI